MKRSEINKAIQTAKVMMEKYSWTLPHWAYWSNSEYENKSELRKYPHSRSLKAIETLARSRGTSSGFKFAEAFFIVRELEK